MDQQSKTKLDAAPNIQPVARSLRINQDMLVARALKNSQLTSGESHVISRTGH